LNQTWQDITLALSGIVLAVGQVEKLAKTGFVDTAQFELCVKALLNTSPKSTRELFESTEVDLSGLFEQVETILNDYRHPKHVDILKYTLGVFHIQGKVAQNKKMLYSIGSKLDDAHNKVEHFGLTHDNVVAFIAQAYTDTISTLPYRIQVNGEYGYLQQQRVANQIRTLLLCAIRFATLWRQVGGKKWHFVFYKKHLLQQAHTLCLDYKRSP